MITGNETRTYDMRLRRVFEAILGVAFEKVPLVKNASTYTGSPWEHPPLHCVVSGVAVMASGIDFQLKSVITGMMYTSQL